MDIKVAAEQIRAAEGNRGANEETAWWQGLNRPDGAASVNVYGL